MSTVIVELPNPLQARLEKMAEELNVSVADLLVDAADQMAQIDTLEKIKKAAEKRNTREAFEKVLAAVPDIPPSRAEDVLEN
jgi:hypothetical protein